MEKFIYLFRGGREGIKGQSPEAMQAHMQKWMAWMKSLGEKGILVAADPLHEEGKQVSGTKKIITDGPFVEAKEIVGGYMIVNAKDIDHAVEISKGCPALDVNGKVEVRPIQKM